MICEINQNLLREINDFRDGGNFQTLKKYIGEEQLKGFINSLYPQFSITEIETITGIPNSTLSHWFNRLGIPFVRNHITNYSVAGNFNSSVIMQNGLKTKKISSIAITPELAYIIGFSLGDGTIEKHSIDVFNKDLRLKKHLLKIMKPFGTITQKKRKDDLWTLRLSSVKISSLIKKNKKVCKGTIDYIFSKEELAKKFIAAFWDAEGSVLKRKNTKNYHDVLLSNSDKYLLLKIKKFIEKNGIKTTIISCKENRKNHTLAGRPINSKKKMYKLRVSKFSFLDWIKLVGQYLKHSKKKGVVKQMEKHYTEEMKK